MDQILKNPFSNAMMNNTMLWPKQKSVQNYKMVTIHCSLDNVCQTVILRCGESMLLSHVN